MDTSIAYTNEALYADSLMRIKAKAGADSSLGFWIFPATAVSVEWRVSFGAPFVGRDSFIGMLEPGEADRMREEWKLFKKRFNDSFSRKNEILFGH